MKKFYIIIIFAVFLLFINNYTVLANGEKDDGALSETEKITLAKQEENITEFKDAFSYAENFVDGDYKWSDNSTRPSKMNIESDIRSSSMEIYKVLVAIGTALTVIVGAALGVSFMLASAEDKAKVKEAMMPYLVGCIIIFGASTIWYFVMMILDKMN